MRTPQFSIRGLLIVMAILAVATGWLADRGRLAHRLKNAAERDLQQRHAMFAMERKIQQLEVNAAGVPDYSWRYPVK